MDVNIKRFKMYQIQSFIWLKSYCSYGNSRKRKRRDNTLDFVL